jgi:hypothetical protein
MQMAVWWRASPYPRAGVAIELGRGVAALRHHHRGALLAAFTADEEGYGSNALAAQQEVNDATKKRAQCAVTQAEHSAVHGAWPG